MRAPSPTCASCRRTARATKFPPRSRASAGLRCCRPATGTDPEPALTKNAEIAPPPAQRDTVPPQATAERRVALVIGNGAYANAPRLANPGRDAEALATSLKHAGFSSVELARDLRRDQLIDALKIFARKAANADWAVIYFAGHGIEVGGMNYLVPVDARLTSDRDIAFEAIPFEQVLQAIDGAHKLRIAILDACRDNPFLNTMTRAMASRSIGRGLAPIEPPRATLVAYAARHGQMALDGDGGHSPYVTALIKNLETPGLEISLLFRKVRDDVLAATSNEQEPFTYGSLPSEAFYFRKQ